MKNKIFFLVLFTVFNVCGIFAQVTTKINDVTLNSQIVFNNCGTIAFGTNSNNTLSFYYKLTKPSAQAIGNSNLKILLKYDSSSYGSEKGNVIVLSGSWSNNTEYIGTISCNISESEIKTTGSSIVLEFVTDSGVKSRSCEYPLNKALPPSFTFYPLSLSLACGDTSSKTFTIIPENLPSGASVTYLESYSNWSLISSTTTTRTLQPSSGTYLPSNVTVMPYINGVAYPSMTCVVTRSSIASSGSISGNATVCTTGTYTFTGLLAGQSLTWSLSNSTAGTLSTATGTSTTFTKTGGGAVDLIATVTNSCGQSYTKTLSLFVGSPPTFSIVRASNETCDIKYHYVPFQINNRNPLFTYVYKVYPILGLKVTQSSQTYNGVTQDILVFPKSYVGSIDFSVTTSNSCGSTSRYVEGEPINSCSGSSLRLSSSVEQFTVFPNPANDIVTIELRDPENQTEKNTTISGELFDMMGQSKSKVKISDNKSTFSVKGLKKGIYILKIYINDQVENHQIAVE